MTTTTQIPCGYAAYFEFIKAPATTQVLIMPEGTTSAHAMTNVSIFRRRLTPVQPRKTWTWAGMGAHVTASRAAMSPDVAAVDIAAVVLNNAMPLLSGLTINKWVLYKEPIVVEVTPEDLEDSRQGKTPYKVFGRVWKVRKALGFPKEFIHATAPAPSF